MRLRTPLAAVALVACVGGAAEARHVDYKGKRVELARGSAPAGGVFRFAVQRADVHYQRRVCFSLVRRFRVRGRVRVTDNRGCPAGVPDTWAVHGRALFDCVTLEMEVAGAAALDVARVELELWDGRRVDADLYQPPPRVALQRQFFMAILQDPEDGGEWMGERPKAIRGYGADGELLGIQRFSRYSGWVRECYGGVQPQIMEERGRAP